jgi:hypothetical protein
LTHRHVPLGGALQKQVLSHGDVAESLPRLHQRTGHGSLVVLPYAIKKHNTVTIKTEESNINKRDTYSLCTFTSKKQNLAYFPRKWRNRSLRSIIGDSQDIIWEIVRFYY